MGECVMLGGHFGVEVFQGVHQTFAELAPRASEPTIDLGDVSVPAPEPVAHRPSHGARRGWMTAAMILVVILGSAPSERGTRYLGDPLWTATAGPAGFALGSTDIVLNESGAAIVGRDLTTGDARWAIPLASQPQSISELGNGVTAVVVRGTTGTDQRGATFTLLVTDGGTSSPASRAARSYP